MFKIMYMHVQIIVNTLKLLNIFNKTPVFNSVERMDINM